MNILFVVSREQDWPNDIPGVTVIPAQTYLMDPAYGDTGSTKVFNLCRTYRYQSKGYYVSLLAEARGHQPLPDAEAMKDLHSETLVQDVTDKLGNLIDCSFSRTQEDLVNLDIYFGQDAEGLHQHLCEQLFKLLRTPVLHARFERKFCTVLPRCTRHRVLRPVCMQHRTIRLEQSPLVLVDPKPEATLYLRAIQELEVGPTLFQRFLAASNSADIDGAGRREDFVATLAFHLSPAHQGRHCQLHKFRIWVRQLEDTCIPVARAAIVVRSELLENDYFASGPGKGRRGG